MQIGPVLVKVYNAPSRKQGATYPGFEARFRVDDKGRRRVTASTLEKLEQKVTAIIRPLVGENDTLMLRGTRLRAYERATQIAGELGLELDEALRRLSDIQNLAKAKNCSVEQAVQYWARHHDESKFSTSVQGVVAAFLEDKKRRNSKEDIDSMKGKLKRFATAFSCPLCDITADEYREYFDAITGGLRNRANHRSTVRRLVNWAKDYGYLARDHSGLPPSAGKVKLVPKRVGVYNQDERERQIKQADPVELPMTLIKAYTPIRAKESGLACWENFDWKSEILMVWADEAKKREPRAIHLPRELCERLRPLAQATGRIYPYKSFYKVGPRLAKRAGLKWIRNGWRTTVISHLQAAVNDLERVAEEAGTSKRKIKSNYLKILSPEDGRAYFGLAKRERHPIEPGYNAQKYGVEPEIAAYGHDELENIIPAQFGAQCA